MPNNFVEKAMEAGILRHAEVPKNSWQEEMILNGWTFYESAPLPQTQSSAEVISLKAHIEEKRSSPEVIAEIGRCAVTNTGAEQWHTKYDRYHGFVA